VWVHRHVIGDTVGQSIFTIHHAKHSQAVQGLALVQSLLRRADESRDVEFDRHEAHACLICDSASMLAVADSVHQRYHEDYPSRRISPRPLFE